MAHNFYSKLTRIAAYYATEGTIGSAERARRGP
jgi:hypothetical protein